MNLKKYSAITILLLSILLLTNGIYAAENNTIDTTQQETINNEENIEQTYVNNYNEFKTAINQIGSSTNKKHEINLKQNTYNLISSFVGEINSETEKEIVINGNNSIINGRNQRPFLSTSKNINLTLNNISIINMHDTFGSSFKNYGTLILNNVYFENNTGFDDNIGGGVIFTDGSTYINNCTFKNNGGNIDGSTIYINERATQNSEINITNCVFLNNDALKSSLIHILGNTTTNIRNTTFTNQNCNGSIIINYKSTLSLEDCVFNQEESSNILSNNEKSIIKNCSFNNNKVENVLINNDYLKIINSKFYENEVKTVLLNYKNMSLNNTELQKNNISESLIINGKESNNDESNLSIYYTTISDNIANQTAGIRNHNTNSFTSIDNSTFLNNTALSDSGILYDYSGTMHVVNSKFYNNTALNLFKGESNNFKKVNNNEYKGNYLNSYLNNENTVFENQLNIIGTIESDEIYNTSITSKIFLKENETIIDETDIINNNFNLLSNIDTDKINELSLFFDGKTDFKNLSKNIEISPYVEEFLVEINNITENYVYGDNITFDLFIKNSGNIIAKNITFYNILPNELYYVNSNETFDNINNKFLLNHLDINESTVIKFNTKPKYYSNLNLSFHITDENSNIYYLEKKVSFIKPTISLERIVAHPGEIINISASINNYNRNSIEDIKLFFQYKEITNLNTKLENNKLTIENFKLDNTLIKKDYNIEIICGYNDLNETFGNSSKVSIVKFETYSIASPSISENLLNLSVKILDENKNNVTSGSVIVKVNGKTIKTLKVNNGLVVLENYRINSNFKNEYNISLVYCGNNIYNAHNNYSFIKENKKIVNLSIDYIIYKDEISISLRIYAVNGSIPDSGYIAFKINDKTIYSKIYVAEYLTVSYKLDENESIQNISASYYGNENFLENISTIRVQT